MLPITPNGAPTPATTQTEPELKDRTSTPRGVLEKNLKTMVYVGVVLVLVLAMFVSSGKKKSTATAPTKDAAPAPTGPGQHGQQRPGVPHAARHRASATAAGRGKSGGGIRHPGATGGGSLLRSDRPARSLCSRSGLQSVGGLRGRRRQQRRAAANFPRAAANPAARGQGAGAAVRLSLRVKHRVQPCSSRGATGDGAGKRSVPGQPLRCEHSAGTADQLYCGSPSGRRTRIGEHQRHRQRRRATNEQRRSTSAPPAASPTSSSRVCRSTRF